MNNLTDKRTALQAILVLGILGGGAACGGGRAGSGPTPEDPAATVAAFLDAANVQDIRAMSNLWGTASGPALRTMNPEVARQRLVVIASFLKHDSFEIIDEPTLADERTRERTIRARLTRSGCQPVVPFFLVRFGGGWIINNIDLAAAGSPTQVCSGRPRL
ncbi:MAG TPA: hypothetical protein VGA22_00845 [Gemmatimonadales bacterium]|jgi:hypothetical protein